MSRISEDPRLQKPKSATYFKEAQGCKGLGDTVAHVTHATGLDKLAEAYTRITGKDCNCGARQATLNRLFPYKP